MRDSAAVAEFAAFMEKEVRKDVLGCL